MEENQGLVFRKCPDAFEDIRGEIVSLLPSKVPILLSQKVQFDLSFRRNATRQTGCVDALGVALIAC